jgi:UDP-N-acetyl-D-mannosaminuronic acid dehydrogenase
MSGQQKRERHSLYGTSASVAEQRRAFSSGAVPVTVYGLGKMGLPLAAVFAEATGNVTGVDIDESVVERIDAGASPIAGEPGVPELVADLVAADALRATTDPVAGAADATVHVVIVPTVLDGTDPDLSNLLAAVEAIGAGLDPGDLVLVESTVPPGTCADVVEPTLVEESGLSADQFGLAFCPERTMSGSALADIRGTHPKVVGGREAESTRPARLVYEHITSNDVLVAPDITSAECVKLFEGLYRDVNIALANELARVADDLAVDVRRAIELANTQPYCDLHDPGPGVGGHCIPYYPWFFLGGTEADAPLIRTARRVNESMPGFTAEKTLTKLRARGVPPAEARVLLLGVTYRPGVTETRESPTYPIAARLSAAGATVYASDPMLESFPSLEAEPVELADIDELALDAVVVITPHEAFDDIDWPALDELLVVDGREALDLGETPHECYTIGGG